MKTTSTPLQHDTASCVTRCSLELTSLFAINSCWRTVTLTRINWTFHFVKPWNVQHLADKDLSNVVVRPCRRNVVIWNVNVSKRCQFAITVCHTVTSRLLRHYCSVILRAREYLTDLSERMVFELQAGNIGDNVALPVPMVDRGRGTLSISRSDHRHRQEQKLPLHHCHTTRHPV